MKILIIHNHYLEKGGEDEVVNAEEKLLTEHGHKVILYKKSNKDIRKLPFFKKLIFFIFELNFSKIVYREIKEIVKKERPDIAHVHNVFICITPSVYFALKELKVPVVQSLHNYRFFCLKGAFFNKGGICEKCKNKRFFSAIAGKCWRNSFILSLFLAKLLSKRNAFLKNIDSYIVTNNFNKHKFAELGLDKQKMYLKTNFLNTDPDENRTYPDIDRNYALFLGRLVDYKGIMTLINAFQINSSVNLKVIGDGPLKKEVYRLASLTNNIECLGRIERNLVIDAIKKSSFLILPSECYENMPLVMIESFFFSKPVIGSCLGPIKEFVVNGVNGLLFEPGNAKDLAAKCSYLFSHNKERLEMGKNANKFYHEHFSKEKNYRDLINIYEETINSKNK